MCERIRRLSALLSARTSGTHEKGATSDGAVCFFIGKKRAPPDAPLSPRARAPAKHAMRRARARRARARSRRP